MAAPTREVTAVGEPAPGIARQGFEIVPRVVAGGIYLSAQLPRHESLASAVVLLAVSALLLAGNLAALSRVAGFPWARFFAVAKWSLLAYAVIAGLIESAFLRNHLSSSPLVLLTLSLVVLAVNLPTL